MNEAKRAEALGKCQVGVFRRGYPLGPDFVRLSENVVPSLDVAMLRAK